MRSNLLPNRKAPGSDRGKIRVCRKITWARSAKIDHLVGFLPSVFAREAGVSRMVAVALLQSSEPGSGGVLRSRIDLDSHKGNDGQSRIGPIPIREAGGFNTTGHPRYACDYMPFLSARGFNFVPPATGYVDQRGDIAVYGSTPTHP
jgi:hypothetical protein